MTDTLSTRPTMEAVTARMEPLEHPIRRANALERIPCDDARMPPQGASDSAADPVPSDPAPDQTSSTPFPQPPERGSLDDEDLVPLVGRHTSDTATIDLIGILQAQMQLRAQEAARFAVWEEQMRLIGTDEALGELERTRLHFTGVIPVQTSPTVVTAGAVPASTALVPERIQRADEAIVTMSSVPEETENPHLQRARQADEALLEVDDSRVAAAGVVRARTSGAVLSGGRIPIIALALFSALVIVVALILAAVHLVAPLLAVLLAAAVLAAAWFALLVVLLLRRPARSGHATEGGRPRA